MCGGRFNRLFQDHGHQTGYNNECYCPKTNRESPNQVDPDSVADGATRKRIGGYDYWRNATTAISSAISFLSLESDQDRLLATISFLVGE